MCLFSLRPISGSLFRHYPGSFWIGILGIVSILQGCSLSVPAGIRPVTEFDVNQYLGHWHEIARLDNRFQRGLTQVTATYSLREDGGIRVENAGWNAQKQQRKTIVGKARFVANEQVGYLKVSFWGPFYGSYVIFYLEADYSVAMVCGARKDCCWILSKNPVLPVEDLAKYLTIAGECGFAVERFIHTLATTPKLVREMLVLQ
jgi:apolipoprotein D and lipocalin family protein